MVCRNLMPLGAARALQVRYRLERCSLMWTTSHLLVVSALQQAQSRLSISMHSGA